MSTSVPTLPLPGTSGLLVPVREVGSSGLDRRAASWAAPDPATVVLGLWSPPTTAPVFTDAAHSPWPAPRSTRLVSKAVPHALVREMLTPPRPGSVPISTIEPMHAVALPDLVALARKQSSRSVPNRRRRSSIPSKPVPASRSVLAPIDATPVRFPRPELKDLVQADIDVQAAQAGDRSGVTGRVLGVVAVGAAACAALAAVAATWF